jgi:hypothetical protein
MVFVLSINLYLSIRPRTYPSVLLAVLTFPVLAIHAPPSNKGVNDIYVLNNKMTLGSVSFHFFLAMLSCNSFLRSESEIALLKHRRDLARRFTFYVGETGLPQGCQLMAVRRYIGSLRESPLAI